jgi:hypothetical protein
MAKATTRRKDKTATTLDKIHIRQLALHEARKLTAVTRRIAAEGRALVRANTAANREFEHVANIYANRHDKVFVDRATWDRIRHEHADYLQRITELEEQAQRQNDLLTTASSR